MAPVLAEDTSFLLCRGRCSFFALKRAMGYTATAREMALLFRNGVHESVIPGTGVKITSGRLQSAADSSLTDWREVPGLFRSLFRSREMEERNSEFLYYIVKPATVTGRGAIILLHGLNERSWDKYIPWAVTLAAGTGRAVLLFPLAYHMNRSPMNWINRHLMMPLVNARNLQLPDLRLSTFVNVALSTRMSISPQRFILSGYQTISDLERLIGLLVSGSVSGIEAGGPVDIFAYSIGALLTQVMMLTDPSPLPPESRVMLFCGGSTFSRMNGTSKLIMDSCAFSTLLSFYLRWPVREMKGAGGSCAGLMNATPAGEAFFAMTSPARLLDLRKNSFRRYDGRLKAVTIAGDRVIPPEAVTKTLRGADAEVWKPGYHFTHEAPFPRLTGDEAAATDRLFNRLFETASRFLA